MTEPLEVPQDLPEPLKDLIRGTVHAVCMYILYMYSQLVSVHYRDCIHANIQLYIISIAQGCIEGGWGPPRIDFAPPPRLLGTP